MCDNVDDHGRREIAAAGAGCHGGIQLVPPGWIATMTTAHTGIPDRPQQYGDLRWVD